MKKMLFSLTASLFALVALQADIPGSYTVKGFDPNAGQPYTGTADITKSNNDIYNGYWSFSDGTHEQATGVLKDGVLSFVFEGVEDPSADTGVQAYKVKHNELSGPWVLFGGDLKGHEEIKKIR